MAEDEGRERIDPGRSMRLMWRLEFGRDRRPARGPKPKLQVEDIVTTAIEIADEEGLDAVSMRRIADRLGVGPMTLYTYIPAKSDLIDLMFDHAVGQAHVELREDAGWRAGLEAIARSQWELTQRHHWFSELPWTRVPLGPNILDAYERAVSVVSGIGLTGREMTEVLTLLTAYVHGAARFAAQAADLPVATSMDDDTWWAGVAPVLETIWDPARFPILTSPEMAHAWDQPDVDHDYFLAEALASFEFGLARMLEGIEAFVDSKRSSQT